MLAPYAQVLAEAFPGNEELQSIASQEMGYIMNCTGGRPSDNAWSAARYVERAIERRDAAELASPTAQARMRDYLKKWHPAPRVWN